MQHVKIPISPRTHGAASRAVRRRVRRGFNLIELLMALAISAMLLTATLVALDASVIAYQSTTESVSTRTIGRITMDRILSLIRTGQEFQPVPANPLDSVVESTFVDFLTPNGQILRVEWVEDDEALYISELDINYDVTDTHLLLEGVPAQLDDDDNIIPPFTLEYSQGLHVHRVTVNLTIVPDDNLSVALEGDEANVIRLIGSAMPRLVAYNSD